MRLAVPDANSLASGLMARFEALGSRRKLRLKIFKAIQR